jgi:hypothetical protein
MALWQIRKGYLNDALLAESMAPVQTWIELGSIARCRGGGELDLEACLLMTLGWYAGNRCEVSEDHTTWV